MSNIFLTQNDAQDFIKGIFYITKIYMQSGFPYININGSAACSLSSIDYPRTGKYIADLLGYYEGSSCKDLECLYKFRNQFLLKSNFIIKCDMLYNNINTLKKTKNLSSINKVEIIEENNVYIGFKIYSEDKIDLPIIESKLNNVGLIFNKIYPNINDVEKIIDKNISNEEINRILSLDHPIDYYIKNIGIFTISRNIIPKEFGKIQSILLSVYYDKINNYYWLIFRGNIGGYILYSTIKSFIVPLSNPIGG